MEKGETRRLPSFFLSAPDARGWDSCSSVRTLDSAREDFLNLPKDFGCYRCVGDETLKGVFRGGGSFPPAHTTYSS